MKISEFVFELEKIKSAHGDLEVKAVDVIELQDDVIAFTEAFIGLHSEEDDSPTEVIIIDTETRESLMEFLDED